METTKKDLRNCLVQYKGGGYDGCFWEWNYFLIDSEGNFNNIFSSGRNGIKDEKDFEKFDFNESSIYIYNLTNKEQIQDFVTNTNENDVLYVAKILYDKYAIILTGFCDECKGEFNIGEGHNTGYKGDGGIGIVYTGLVCNECFWNYSCDHCGEYIGSEEQKYCSKGEFCKDCFEKEFKEFPDELINEILFDIWDFDLEKVLQAIRVYFPESILRDICTIEDLEKMADKFEMVFKPLDTNNKKLYGFFKIGYEWPNPNQLSLF